MDLFTVGIYKRLLTNGSNGTHFSMWNDNIGVYCIYLSNKYKTEELVEN